MLTPLTMYKCEYCKKVFKTQNRHNCKHDPAHKNCLTCKHQMGFDKHEGQYDYYGECVLPPYAMPNCSFKDTEDFGLIFGTELDKSEGDFIDVMWRKQWKLDCPAWELKEES